MVKSTSITIAIKKKQSTRTKKKKNIKKNKKKIKMTLTEDQKKIQNQLRRQKNKESAAASRRRKQEEIATRKATIEVQNTRIRELEEQIAGSRHDCNRYKDIIKKMETSRRIMREFNLRYQAQERMRRYHEI